MNVEILARLQFALTIMFHYIYPPLSIGLGLLLVIMEGLYLKTGDLHYLHLTKFWTKVFALTFAMGVATGIVMEFEFGTNWATYSRYVGDVFGSALAAEGVFAFFLESGFLAVVLFGFGKVRPKFHFFATVMVALGAHFSAVWIVVANSWMQTPAGFHIVGEGMAARAEIVDFWAMVFNPSSVPRLTHTLVGCHLAGSFLVLSVSAYYLLKKQYIPFAKRSLKIGLFVSCVATVLQLFLGDVSARGVAIHQPSKLAAMEGVYTTVNGAPLYLFGVPNGAEKRVDYAIAIPKLLSYFIFGDSQAEVAGLDQIPPADHPHVASVFQTYHLMVAMWICMAVTLSVALYTYWKNTIYEKRWVLKALVISAFYPQIANQAGWVTAEMGRYPWIVQNHLRISEGLSKAVTASQVMSSIILFGFVYLCLFILFVYLLHDKFRKGPLQEDEISPYHNMEAVLQGGKNE